MILVLMIGIYQASNIFNEAEVLIGYENEDGKQKILEHSSNVEHHYQNLSAFSVTMNKNRIQDLKKHPDVAYITENIEVSISADQITEISELLATTSETENWNIKLTGAEKAWMEGSTGKGADIAVIDTGVSPHSDLIIDGGISTVEYTDSWHDDFGHGTHVAGVIAASHNGDGVVGVAPDANIYAVKALDENGEGQLDDILEAIDWSIENGMDIINLSLGTEIENPLLEEILEKAYESGILTIAASGNSGEDLVIYPAKYKNVIAVSAVDGRMNPTTFTSTGEAVEFSAPGINIKSTYLDNSYGIASGTSQAVPHVTGMLALLMEKYPEKSHIELREELIHHVNDLGADGRDAVYGHGFISYLPDDQKAPNEVSGLTINEITTNSVTFSWNNPTNIDFNRVAIYMNDSWIGNVDGEKNSIFSLENLEAGKEYVMTLYTEDQIGNMSNGVTMTFTTYSDDTTEDSFKTANNGDLISEENRVESTSTGQNQEQAESVREFSSTKRDFGEGELAPSDLNSKTENRSPHNMTNSSTEGNQSDLEEEEKLESLKMRNALPEDRQQSSILKIEEVENSDSNFIIKTIEFIRQVIVSIGNWFGVTFGL